MMDRSRSILGRRGGSSTVPTVNDAGEETPSARGGGSALGSVTGQVGRGVGDIKAGRMSLAALEVAVLALVIFYVWTRSVQGGG